MSGTCTSIINLRYQDGSEGSSSNPAKFNNQDYQQLQNNHIRRQKLFMDSSFPPNMLSLGNLEALRGGLDRRVQWRRPKDILKNQGKNIAPVFISAGISRFDFGQGSVGNCWFLAAISALTLHEKLLGQVVPMNQSFENYAGIFHFRFWRYGKWVDVVIDDFLPTIGDQFISVHTKGGNEFWVPLLEKAYAKVCGSYADMNAGLTTEACKDLSGGVPMSYQLHQVHDANHDEELWLHLRNATGCNSMICCGTASQDGKIVNSIAHTGLVDAHAYSVTGVTEITYRGYEVRLVRVMNPWGKTEWNGNWSDGSYLWNEVSRQDRDKCVKREDGEFWIELEDFCHSFNMMSICCENPNFLDGDVTCQWKCMIYDGSWVAGRTSGGNLFRDSFYRNPQYGIQVTNINEAEVKDKNILICLMQKGQHQNRRSAKSYPIGLTIFKVPPGTRQGRLGSYFFRSNRPIKKEQRYTYERELIEVHSLQPGEYVIIPSVTESHMSTDFVLSIYTKADAKITPHDKHDDDDDDDDHDHDNGEEKLVLPEIPTEEKHIEEDNATRALFNRYADQNGELNSRQLQKLLNDNFPHGTWEGFGLDTCMSMIAAVDNDKRMKLMSFSEFSPFWTNMMKYKKLFQAHDVNGNGTLNDNELENALRAEEAVYCSFHGNAVIFCNNDSAVKPMEVDQRQCMDTVGIDIDNSVISMIVFRFSFQSSTDLQSFLTLMLRMEKITAIFKNKASNGIISLTQEEWTLISVYL